jgi:uncharacterized protein
VTPERPYTGDTAERRRCRSLKRRRLRLLLDLMGRVDRPERVAAALALGVGVGLSPFIGFHFILAVVLAWIFRLHKLDTVIGSFAGNPWTLPPVFAAGYRLGRILLGYPPVRVPPLKWERILHHDFWVAFRGPGLSPRLASFLVGTTLIAAVAAFATYFFARAFLKLYHRRHPRVAQRAARRREHALHPATDEIEIRPDTRVH